MTFGSYVGELSLRVSVKNREQFGSRVARRSDYAYFYQNFYLQIIFYILNSLNHAARISF